MRGELEVPKPILDLREAMDRVRTMQAASGMIIDMARYDSETMRTNADFLAGFLGVLPIEPRIISSDYRIKSPDGLCVKDPVFLRPLGCFGLLLSNYNDVKELYSTPSRISIIIGEKKLETGFTEVLSAGWAVKDILEGGEKEAKRKFVPQMYSFKVPGESWHDLRQKAVSRLHIPLPAEVIKSLHNRDNNSFVTPKDTTVIGMIDAVAPRYVIHSDSPATRKLRKAKRYSRLDQLRICHIDREVKPLHSSDFEEYDVMTNMEYVVGAFGVGAAFDRVKAKREAAMPQHPAERLFGLNGYRQAIEQGVSINLLSAGL
jgi:hypothetical protein